MDCEDKCKPSRNEDRKNYTNGHPHDRSGVGGNLLKDDYM